MTQDELDAIAAIRLMIGEPNDAGDYTDAKILSLWHDLNEADYAVASELWSRKASQYAMLVDVKEGSSARSLGQLHQQALTMARHYGSIGTYGAAGARRTTTRAIERA